MAALNNHPASARLIYGEGTSGQTWAQSKPIGELQSPAISELFPEHCRVIIVAPHPDDEILGCAGLVQKLAKLKRQIVLVAVTNGTQSHPNSAKYTPEYLNQVRPAESLQALEALQVVEQVQRIELNIKDGQITQHYGQFYAALQAKLEPHDILITTYQYDGHPDHEICGKLCQQLAKDSQLICYQVLIWTWHWATPDEPLIDWSKCFKVNLTHHEVEKKKNAILCFNSQCETDPTTLQPPILSELTIERILQPYEVYYYG